MLSQISNFLASSAILSVAEVVLAGLLIGAILIQSQGTGLSSSFGGEGGSYRTRRGLEKTLFRATIVLAALFFSVALLNVLF